MTTSSGSADQDAATGGANTTNTAVGATTTGPSSMSGRTGEESRNLAVAQRFIDEVLVGQNLAALDDLVADDVVVNSGIRPLEPMVGRPAFADGLKTLAAFTFTDFTLEDLFAAGDRVVARYRAHGRHTGNQLGVPATGKDITMWEIRLMRLRDGRIVQDYVADINYDWPWLVAPAYPDGIGRTGRN